MDYIVELIWGRDTPEVVGLGNYPETILSLLDQLEALEGYGDNLNEAIVDVLSAPQNRVIEFIGNVIYGVSELVFYVLDIVFGSDNVLTQTGKLGRDCFRPSTIGILSRIEGYAIACVTDPIDVIIEMAVDFLTNVGHAIDLVTTVVELLTGDAPYTLLLTSATYLNAAESLIYNTGSLIGRIVTTLPLLMMVVPACISRNFLSIPLQELLEASEHYFMCIENVTFVQP